jgi:chromosome segregation protein
MRLTHVKLAGFKSFVDPTSIGTPGQLVGIVGPNGCGKSNVIDAVRWVLGESRASALRGESMQDVIFNGAGERKPVGRASVELVFDNSQGRVGGQWGQYAELSIKRVLQRNGESSYYINNIGVRRRDIQDLFLGTGLGPRAYAIIEQGMISRIIEAKPEELRVFLEEAAGVSKYKERRKETEARLADTRENLLRVEDIRGELAQQLEKLASQAQVAAEYRELEARLGQAQQLLWFSRHQDAQRQRQRHAADIAALGSELEGLHAALRSQEAAIERMRGGHYEANDDLHAAQGLFYEASAEVTRLEQQLAFQRESAQRLRQQAGHAAARLEELVRSAAQIETERAARTSEHAAAEARLAGCRAQEQQAAAALPEQETAARTAAQEFSEAQSSVAAGEQSLRLAEAKREHVQRMLQQLDGREQRLRQEEASLAPPVDGRMTELEASSRDLQTGLAAREERRATLRAELEQFEGRQRIEREQSRRLQQRQTEVEARIEALAALQAKLGRTTDAAGWLERQGLASASRLWQEIAIAPGWEDALEAVLRERVNAIHVADLDAVAGWPEPPGRIALFASAPDTEPGGDGDSLLGKLEIQDERTRATVAAWLHGVRCAASIADALARRAELAPTESFVTGAGHVVSRGSLATFAPDAELHGVLARQRELKDLETTLVGVRSETSAATAALAATEESLRGARAGLESENVEIAKQQRACHDVELQLAQLRKAAEAALQRRRAIGAELVDIARQADEERSAEAQVQAAISAARGALDDALQRREGARHRRNEAEVALVRAREALRAAERATQEAAYAERATSEQLAELARRQAENATQLGNAESELQGLAADQARVDWTSLESALQSQLASRSAREAALAAARDRLESATAALRSAEEERLRVEQQLEPARARLEELRLKEQAAQLQEQQYLEQLQSAGAELAALPDTLKQWGRASQLPGEIDRVQKAIAALGAVNLAALDELKAATERKDFLDRQAGDLQEAIETLESAIRRIDRETRELLQTTFDEVNGHFGRLFPALFGGGSARLLLTGEEILDAGVQVIAQPPGKRNASIHLLSGGEKALTAISLVFALFQLNPAPFCLLDEVDAPLDDPNTERFCRMVSEMSKITQFVYISHNKITMEMASQLIGITMPEPGVSHVVAVDIAEAIELARKAA